MLEKDFKDIITNLIIEIRTIQIKTTIQSNKNLIDLYYRLGKILNDNF